MRRRDFLTTGAAAAIGQSLLAKLAAAQEVLGDAKETLQATEIDVPGLGRVSLNPADYDAETLGRLFGQDFAAGVAWVREHYADAVTALQQGDAAKMATLAAPLITQASRAAGLPLVGDGLRGALLDEPRPEPIQAARSTAPPVYYVNGMFTPHDLAREEARELARRLPGRAVWLLYNQGTPPSVDRRAAGKDLEEAFRDRVWPLQLTRMLRGKSLGAGVGWAIDSGSPLQHNPTTRQLAGLLHKLAGEQPGGGVGIVGYSQGAMIARNALFTLALLGKQAYAEQRVALVAPGLPISNHEVWPVPAKFTPIVDPSDPVPAYLGLQGDGFQAEGAGLEHHRWFEDGYASRIRPGMLTV
ncbi:MAG: hypothetical protein AAF790_02860 [Planctomycetota bacterium]